MTTEDAKAHHRARLPDEPRWVETRDLLAWAGSTFAGHPDGRSFVVWSEKGQLGAIVGEPNADAIRAAGKTCGELIAFADNIDFVRLHLPTFEAEPATLLTWPDAPLPTAGYPTRWLRDDEVDELTHIRSELREELSDTMADGKGVLTALDEQLPVAFAYVASETETLWNVSIDTAAGHRRRGFASSAALGLMSIMSARGKTAVWGAARSNPASLHLARKLGFAETDEIWLLTKSAARESS